MALRLFQAKVNQTRANCAFPDCRFHFEKRRQHFRPRCSVDCPLQFEQRLSAFHSIAGDRNAGWIPVARSFFFTFLKEGNKPAAQY